MIRLYSKVINNFLSKEFQYVVSFLPCKRIIFHFFKKKNMKRYQLFSAFKSLLVITFLIYCFSEMAYSQTFRDPLGEAYFFKRPSFPFNQNTSWGNSSWGPNGIGHTEYEFIIGSCGRDFDGMTDNLNWKIWKIPASYALNRDMDNNPNVLKWQNSPVYPVLFPNNSTVTSNDLKKTFKEFQQYGHAGDIDAYKHTNGQYYILVPLTGHSVYMDSIDRYYGHHMVLLANEPKPAIAFFRASDMKFINYAYLDPQQRDVGWCSVNHRDLFLYTSNDETEKLFKYKIYWEKILGGIDHDGIALQDLQPALRNGNNTNNVHLFDMQGAEFSPSGDLLYVSSGMINCSILGWSFSVNHPNIDGIHVFKFENPHWVEVRKSDNSSMPPSAPSCFDVKFDSDGCHGDELEGITVWDLDGKSVPNCSGQLHVILDNHTDNTTIQHFKRYNVPKDLVVYATTSVGTPKSNPAVVSYLAGTSYNGCAWAVGEVDPVFNPGLGFPQPLNLFSGDNKVTFTITDNYIPSNKVKRFSKIKVINSHDECATALTLAACSKTRMNNYAASLTNNIPSISGYSGLIKDVFVLINKPNTSSFSVETQQVLGGLTHTVIQLLSGMPGNLQEVASDTGQANFGQAKITMLNYTGSWPLYLRITDYGGDDLGQFDIYFKKIATNSNIFTATSFVTGESGTFMQYPALTGDVNGDGRTDFISASSAPAISRSSTGRPV